MVFSKILIQNMSNNRQIELNQVGNTNYVFKNEDIDWGSADAQHNIYTYPGQVGSYISSTTVKERTVVIRGYIVYIPTEAERANSSSLLTLIESKLRDSKNLLSSVVNPLQYLKVTVGNYYIIGKPNSSVVFGKKIEENNEYFCKFTISLYCSDPLFYRKTNIQTVLSGSKPGFHFPLILKKTGFVFGRRYSYSLINVVNDGDVPVGGVFIVQATGTVKNIKIENVHTGKFIKIYKTLTAGEKIIINTTDGKERSIIGEVDGEKKNYFQYWGFEGSWLQFVVGSSLIGYSVEEGEPQNVNISFELNTKKYSLRDS